MWRRPPVVRSPPPPSRLKKSLAAGATPVPLRAFFPPCGCEMEENRYRAPDGGERRKSNDPPARRRLKLVFLLTDDVPHLLSGLCGGQCGAEFVHRHQPADPRQRVDVRAG